jgi:WD40 repeat protein
MQHDGPVRALAFDRRDRFLATGSDDGTLRLWKAHTGEAVGKPMKHGGPVRAVAFDPNGKVLASGSSDNAARLWLALSPQTLFNRGRTILGPKTKGRTLSPSVDFVSWIEKKIGAALERARSLADFAEPIGRAASAAGE